MTRAHMDSQYSTDAGDHYIKSLEVHRRKSGNLDHNNALLNKHLPLIIQTILNERPQQRRQFRILSVGSCTGKTDFEIIKIVKSELQRNEDSTQVEVFNQAVEPNGESLQRYREALENKQDQTNVVFDLRQKTFEEYIESKNDTLKFDIIHFVHSINYVDIEKALVHCFEQLLKKSGIVVIFVVGKDLLYQTCKKQGHVWNKGKQTALCWMTAEDIVEMADGHGWKYHVFNQEYAVDVTDVFDEESIEGNLLLDFLTYVKEFRNTVDKKQVEETLDLIRQLSTTKDDGKRFGKRLDELLFIYK